MPSLEKVCHLLHVSMKDGVSRKIVFGVLKKNACQIRFNTSEARSSSFWPSILEFEYEGGLGFKWNIIREFPSHGSTPAVKSQSESWPLCVPIDMLAHVRKGKSGARLFRNQSHIIIFIIQGENRGRLNFRSKRWNKVWRTRSNRRF